MGKQALVLGATGMVGTELVKQLAEDRDYDRIKVLVRKPMSFNHPKLEQIKADYDKLGAYTDAFKVDAVYCCLGTTMKTAGSKAAFRRVDLDYPVEAARLAREAGVRLFAVVSALGADEGSMFFYNRVKGEMERLLRESGLPSLYIFRPSLLLGNRQERRTGEAASVKLSRSLPFLWAGPNTGHLMKYSSISNLLLSNFIMFLWWFHENHYFLEALLFPTPDYCLGVMFFEIDVDAKSFTLGMKKIIN